MKSAATAVDVSRPVQAGRCPPRVINVSAPRPKSTAAAAVAVTKYDSPAPYLPESAPVATPATNHRL